MKFTKFFNFKFDLWKQQNNRQSMADVLLSPLTYEVYSQLFEANNLSTRILNQNIQEYAQLLFKSIFDEYYFYKFQKRSIDLENHIQQSSNNSSLGRLIFSPFLLPHASSVLNKYATYNEVNHENTISLISESNAYT